ncbi:MAG: phosphonate ABC transporter ATP-binding protein [Nitrospinae bacterium CG11_big_fil_rev_8_21_14_0_20_56_8]|nr:MAG: phosphonate ABC transporter ATP-binding protein [Nitrospinae bacterium CG11_big_fil_rev_8_21_14_0_20_56_8]
MLEIRNLSKTYSDGTPGLIDLSLTIEPGEFVTVLGRSGSGKSTFLRCVNRLIEPTAGRIFLAGEEITGISAAKLRVLRRKIGMIFQQFNLVRRLTVLANTLSGRLGYHSAWAAMIHHFPRQEIETALRRLDRLGIGDKAGQKAESLSGGQQQRVGIARALMQEPEILLADEPVSSLDPASARVILDILREINRNEGVTVVCNLHQPDLAREYGGRVLALQQGRLVFDGPPQRLDSDTVDRIYRSA